MLYSNQLGNIIYENLLYFLFFRQEDNSLSKLRQDTNFLLLYHD